MEQLLNEIRLVFSDPAINDMLKNPGAAETSYTRHYNQNEDFFLKLASPFSVPSFAVHHDVRIEVPLPDYQKKMQALIRDLVRLLPSVFGGLTYLFDPAETHRPSFYQLYRLGERAYLFLLRIDLLYRPSEHETLLRGSNDETASYRTNRLYLDAELIPLEGVVTEGDKVRGFRIRQSVSSTWIGERGRGYFVQGIWIDRELTKFFSRLFLPPGKRVYPYFPFTCRHRAVSHSLVRPEAEGRKSHVPLLHKAEAFLEPRMKEIEEALQGNDFSENLDQFKRMKAEVPSEWERVWDSVELRSYLNDQDMKEYQLADPA